MAGSDTDQLHALGYAQELRRGMRTFSNFAVSFTIISILSGCLTLFYFAMNFGGPAVMTIGWLIFGLAFFINAFLNIVFGVSTAPAVTIVILAIVLFIHGLLNTFGIRLVKLLNDVSVWWESVKITAIVLVTVVLNQHSRTDIGTVFSTFVNNSGSGGDNPECPGVILFGIPLYVILIGFLNAQYTLTGYDASAHMSEETHDAHTSAPRGIVFSVVISVIMGFILLTAMNVGITPDKVFPAADGTANGAAGYQHALDSAGTLSNAGPPITIWIDAVGQMGTGGPAVDRDPAESRACSSIAACRRSLRTRG